jgi:hypothetical protein
MITKRTDQSTVKAQTPAAIMRRLAARLSTPVILKAA